MICKNNTRFCNCNCKCCSNMNFSENDIETKCNNVQNCSNLNNNECSCGFDDDFNVFPSNPMYGQSYVPIQIINKTFTPSAGLKHGTIFPELVSPYCPNQSIEEIEYIKATNTIREGCNG